jgi:hypothetical protein
MTDERPMERKRARKGLGARSPEGETTKATPKGRMTEVPRGSFSPHDAASDYQVQGRPREPRARQAKRRTVRDNPDAKRSKKT